jgi:P4 family phage/plasmid primase-like protien
MARYLRSLGYAEAGRDNLLDCVATIDEPLCIEGKELDQQEYLLACPNCVIDLRTGESSPGKPEQYILNACPTEWQGLTPSRRFMDFLLSCMDGDAEMVSYILRLLGYGLLGRRDDHIWAIFHGPRGRNGKDTLMKILFAVLGSVLVIDVPTAMLMQQTFQRSGSQPEPDIMALRGAKIAFASEGEAGQKIAMSKLKKLTGGSIITARGINDKLMTSWKQTHLLFFLTNELPKMRSDDDAFWTRLHAVHWPIPSEQWRRQAGKFALAAHERLLGQDKLLSYLAGRGLPLEAVRHYRIGYLEGEDKSGTCLYRARSAFGLPDKPKADGKTASKLWIPRGLTIPFWQGEEVQRLRLRRRKEDLRQGDSKYMLLEGSGQAPMTLPPVNTAPDLAVWVAVEAELDAMAVHHACGGGIGAIAVLTNRGKPDAAAHKLLSRAAAILVALDFDPPGKKGERPGYQGWLWWSEHYAQAKRWPVPVGKDPGEAVARGADLAAWVRAGIPAALPRFGNMGIADSGLSIEGSGLAETPVSDPAPVSLPTGWQGARADTPLAEAVLPDGLGIGVAYLHKYYSGQAAGDDLLVPCPMTKKPWWWIDYKHCRRCAGHPLCLLEFLLSPQMLAPAGAPEDVHA